MPTGENIGELAEYLPDELSLIRAIMDAVPDPIFCKDREGRFLLTNRANNELFEISGEEFAGKTVFEVPGLREHADIYHADDMRVMNTGAPVVSREEPFERRDGGRGWFLTSKFPLRDVAGKIVGLVGIARDISVRKSTEHKLAAEHDLLETVLNGVEDPIFFKDRESCFLLQNEAYQRFFNPERLPYEGRTDADFPGLREHASSYRADDLAVLTSEQPVINREEPFTTPEGRKGWFLTCKFPMRDPGGAIIGLIGICRDVTERKEAERRIGEERTFLRTLIDAIPDLIFFKDREGRHLHINAADWTLFGVGDDKLGTTVHEWPIPRDIADAYAADDRSVIETGEPIVNREEPFARTDGTRGWFLTSKLPLRNAAGEITGLVGIARDVTQLKSDREELERAQQRLVDHVENSPLAVIEWHADFRVERWSGQAQAIFGWDATEVVGKHFGDWPFVHADDEVAMREVAQRLLDGRDLRNTCQSRNLTKSGAIVHCAWQNSVLRDATGRIVTILSLVQDVTERVKAEALILENERLYHTLVEATNTGYCMIDERGHLLEANDEYVRLTGRTSFAEIQDCCLTEWTALHDLERNTHALRDCLDHGWTKNLEIDYVTPEGRIVPVEINARVRPAAGAVRIIAFCRDISDRRRAESERREIERKLRDTQKLESLGVLAGGIAHDFNNLLTGVLGNASLAGAELPPSSPIQDYIQQIELAATRAADLCKQMLAYSGKGRFVVRRLDVNSVLQETTSLLQVSINKSVVLHLDLIGALPAVQADATQIRQIIMNLVINASEAIGERSGMIRVRTGMMRADRGYLAGTCLVRDNMPEGDYVFIEVSDTGCGMTPEVRAKIFDPFFTTKFTGRGLGLAAVLGIVRGHGGALRVESVPGQGSTFRVLLPCAEGPADMPTEQVPAGQGWHGHGTVLVVDDEETVRTTTARMLEALGFKVLLAEDGIVALEKFAGRENDIVLVLLDLTMPRLGGEETLIELRARRPETRVVLMSGFSEPEIVARFSRHDLAGFIQKPFTLAALRERLQHALV